MAPKIDYDLDAEGDVILTLENPNEPFAVWADEVEPWEQPRSPPPVLDDSVILSYRQIDPAWNPKPEPAWILKPKTKARARKIQSSNWAGFQEAEPFTEPVEAPEMTEAPEIEEPEVPADLSNPTVEETSDLPDISEMEQPEQMGSEDDEAISHETPEVRFRLSSRHLISASPYFKKMLTGQWKESASRDISAEGWDEGALKLLMDIIHGNSQNVPRSIDLELLAKVAVLVDYYQCYDVVKFYSDTWIDSLDDFPEIPHYSREFVLILFVSCVFFRSDTFRVFTREAMRKTHGPLRTLDLPFPHGVIENIERNRADAVGRLLDSFHNLLQYFGTRDRCHFECNAILVGLLYREMFAQGILSPRPASPFHGFSVEKALQMARDASSPKGSEQGVCGGSYYRTSPTCSLREFLDPLTDQVKDSLKALELTEYVDDPWGK